MSALEVTLAACGLVPEDLLDVYYGGPSQQTVRLRANEVNWGRAIRWARVGVEDPLSRGVLPSPPSAPDLLDAAAKHMRDRAATYDKPDGERSMARAVAAFNAATGQTLTEPEGWMFMAVLKMVRDCTAPGGHPDSQEDGIAYLALAGEARRRQTSNTSKA